MMREKKAKTVDPSQEKIFFPTFRLRLLLLWHSCRHLTEKLIIAAGLNQSQSAVAGKDGFGLSSCSGEQENTSPPFHIFGDEQAAETRRGCNKPRS
jgi:hypothetical protein